MAKEQKTDHLYRVADLPALRATRFDITPDRASLQTITERLQLLDLRKLRFTGDISAAGKHDWLLTAKLGATVVQSCVVTLAPVTTRIDQPVVRRFSADYVEGGEEEFEIPGDEDTDPLTGEIDLIRILEEALVLALPTYPRAGDAELTASVFAAPGVTPLTDKAVRPFAGLAALKARMDGDQDAD